jgi:hypothetical protein
MSDKTYVFDSGANNNLASILPALLQNKGIDPSVLAAMGNGGFGGFGNNGLFDILLLFILFGAANNGNGFGFGGNGNNGANSCVMQAVERNGFSIQTLATALNTSTNDVMQAVNALGTQICNLGYQTGQNTNQIVTAILQGNNSIQSQIASCCCDLKTLLSQGFSSIGFETQKQTCAIEKSIADSTAQILAGQRAAEMRELQREIATLQEEKQTYKLGNMMAQANAPLAQAISALQSDVDGIKCKMPKTVTLPYADAQAVPNCVAFQYGLYGGFPNGVNGAFF